MVRYITAEQTVMSICADQKRLDSPAESPSSYSVFRIIFSVKHAVEIKTN